MNITERKGLPKPIKLKNTAIYCRLSTSAYDLIHSLNNQMEGLMDYICRRPGLKFYDVYVDVMSGKGKYERQNMDRLIRDCMDGKYSMQTKSRRYVCTAARVSQRFYRKPAYFDKRLTEVADILPM